jgi:hypothetical protein
METTFKNDQKIKDALIKRMDHHIEMDELLQGSTGSGGKGCTVWCALNNGELKKGYDHSAFPDVLGLPEWLARLHDVIYEGLETEDSKWFSKEWVRAIPVGVNVEPVKWKFSVFLLKENIDRVLSLEINEELKTKIVDSIRQCLSVNESAILTGVWDESAAESARSAAESARSAAWSARSAAESARSAAWSAWSAKSAAWSAAKSAAWSAAESAKSAAKSAAESAWSAAESAAWSAKSAAWSAAESARSAAKSAAKSAAESAWSAAESAARSAAESAAKSAAYKRYAIELLRMFSEL